MMAVVTMAVARADIDAKARDPDTAPAAIATVTMPATLPADLRG
jgi:hypothetical protein